MKKLSFKFVNHFAQNNYVMNQAQGLQVRFPELKDFDFSIADKGDEETY